MYLVVDSIDPVLEKVPGLGGSVTTARTEIPGQGWYAVINDSEDTEIGLFERQPA
jgi:predicted enzyme related to lactoylglutathione lyase